MATIPSASVHVEATAAAPANGDDTIVVLAPVAQNADMTPRLFGTPSAIYDQHGYSEGLEYSALHLAQTGHSVLFVGMPIGTPGAVSRTDSSGNTDSCVVTAVAGSDGVLSEHEGVVRVVSGGTIGTDQIRLEVSLDGGFSFQPVRLGTENSYELGFVNVTLNFAAGDLTAGDTVLTWFGSAPLIDTSDVPAVFEALAAGSKLFRSALVCGDMPDDTSASAVNSEAEDYASEVERFVYVRVSAYDRFPQAQMSHEGGRMTGNPTLTFANVGASGDTITRSTGSWIADGFVTGDTVTVTGTASNNVSGVFTVTSATVLTAPGATPALAAEVIAANAGPVVIVSSPTLTFTASGDTVVRNRGSWLTDGFRIGDTVNIDGTASNDVSLAASNVAALTLTLANGLTDETIKSSAVEITTNQTKAAWMAELDAEFASIDAAPRIDISAGRGRVFSPYSGWFFRRPAAWAASLREYGHDLHVATWRKDLGPTGFDLFDSDNQLVEWDDRVDGGAASAARFTSFRTWANGPRGAFITQSLTRAGDGQIMSQTHNAAVVNAACTTVQQATENVIGRTLQLNDDGTATKESLAVIAAEVNAALELALLTSRGEGPRASKAVWTPNPADVYNVPEPLMTGTLELNLNGTIHSVDTSVRIRTNGQ